MSYNIINVPIEYNNHTYRHFCTIFDKNVYLEHIDPKIEKGIASGYVNVFHNFKKVRAGIDKEIQKQGRKDLVYYDNVYSMDISYDELINDDVFLLYDETGLNYVHFFFDFFGRCLYYDKLKKDNPNLKLGILEDFYREDGNSTFIKQWLKLYYGDDIDIIVFKKKYRYKINKLILSNVFYWFPEPEGHEPILNKIIEIASKIEVPFLKKGCYISRQDTIKRGWYHSRELINELELIDKIKNELGYDIIELMNYDLIDKIKIFKSYRNIIHQSSASNVSLFFSNSNNTNVIISHPIMESWLNYKCLQFAMKSGTNLITLDGGGECIKDLDLEDQADKNNLAWKLNDIDQIIEVIKQIDSEEIWKAE